VEKPTVIDIDRPFPYAAACLPTVVATPSLEKVGFVPGTITVIVITRKDSLEKVRKHSQKYFRQGASQVLVVVGGHTPGEGRNCGAVNATGEWLVFLDDDTDFNGPLSVVKGKWDWGSAYFKGAGVDDSPLNQFRNYVVGATKDQLTEMPAFMAGWFTFGSFIFVRQTAFFKVGGFVTGWWRNEDNVIGARLAASGAKYHQLSHRNPAIVSRWSRGMLAIPYRYAHRRHLAYVHAGRSGRVVWIRNGKGTFRLAVRGDPP
jgi:glycosyltransferase involved in cell wall biosynthesis